MPLKLYSIMQQALLGSCTQRPHEPLRTLGRPGQRHSQGECSSPALCPAVLASQVTGMHYAPGLLVSGRPKLRSGARKAGPAIRVAVQQVRKYVTPRFHRRHALLGCWAPAGPSDAWGCWAGGSGFCPLAVMSLGAAPRGQAGYILHALQATISQRHVEPRAHSGAAQPQAVPVHFTLMREVKDGDCHVVVGDHPALGGWKIDHAPKMIWADGHVWEVEVLLPPGTSIEFKVRPLQI